MKTWIQDSHNNPMWFIENIQSSGEYLKDIKSLLSWFDQDFLTENQLSASLEEYYWSNNIRTALMAIDTGLLTLES